jgi:serine/threonine protein kinase
MAPEMFENNSHYNSGVDIWAFGIILYYMFFGFFINFNILFVFIIVNLIFSFCFSYYPIQGKNPFELKKFIFFHNNFNYYFYFLKKIR